MSPLQKLARPGYVSGSPRPYAGGRTLRVRLSSIPCARRNGRASASLTARGGGFPIGVMKDHIKSPGPLQTAYEQLAHLQRMLDSARVEHQNNPSALNLETVQ